MTNFYPNPAESTTTAPYRRTVGIEVEIASGATTCQWLYDNGYAPSGRLHGYHCSCGDRDLYPIHPTEDGTAGGGEYLLGGSRGMLFGSPEFYRATSIMEEALLANRATANFSVGSHTHVGADDLNERQKKILLRNYLAYQEEISVLAAGPFSQVRANGCTSPWLPPDSFIQGDTHWTCDVDEWTVRNFPGRPTFNMHGAGRGTVEFRVWNTSLVQWRMVLATGFSSAFVEAAKQERVAKKPSDNPPLAKFLEGLLTSDVMMLMHRQIAYFESIEGTPTTGR